MGLNRDIAVGYVTEFVYGPNAPSARFSCPNDVSRAGGVKFGLTLCYKNKKSQGLRRQIKCGLANYGLCVCFCKTTNVSCHTLIN